MFVRDPEIAWERVLVVCSLTFVCTVGAWLDFGSMHTFEAHDHWDSALELARSRRRRD